MGKKTEKEHPEQQTAAENKPVFRRIGISCSDETDGNGYKNYRTVFAAGEVQKWYVDVEWQMSGGGEGGEMELAAGLFRIEGEKSFCIAQAEGKIEPVAETEIYTYSFCFSDEGEDNKLFTEGMYGVVVQVNGQAVQSDALYILEGKGDIHDYFQLTQIGIDKVCEETDKEAESRPHSFSCLDIGKLGDVRLYFMAENLLVREWVYEFTVVLSHRNGMFKARKEVKGKQFVKDRTGKSYLYVAVDLGTGTESFWREGEYNIRVVAFDRPVFSLDFTIDAREIPYDFAAETAAGGVSMSLHHSLLAGTPLKNKDEILDRLYRLVGLRKVKEEITRICEYAAFIRMRRENGFSDNFPPLHLLFSGNPGSGKNTIAEIVGELFCSLGILSHGRVAHYGRKDLVQEGYAMEEQAVRRLITANTGGVIVIDDAGDLYDGSNPRDRGILTLNALVNILQKEKPEVVVILSDDNEGLALLIQVLPEIRKCFPKQFYFEDYTPEELMVITRNKLEKRQLRFTPGAEDKFFKLLKRAAVGKGFGGGEFIDEQLEEIARRMAKRLMNDRSHTYEREAMMTIRSEDVICEPEVAPDAGLEKLDEIIGAPQLKQSIVHHLNYVYFIQERQRQGFDDVMPPLNMIFSGNPGTGKLTVAKMLGEIYYSAGLLAEPGVIVQNGHNLSLETGVPAEQMVGMLLQAAAGAILYMEHACALFQTKAGLMFFEALLGAISPEEFDQMIIILADVPEEIQKTVQANPALRTYFPYQFDFKDYTPEELLDIAVQKLKEKKYVLHPRAREVFSALIRRAYGARDKHFGNAVWVDKLVSVAIRKMSDRLMQIRKERELTRKELTTLMAADVPEELVEVPGLSQDNFEEEEIEAALHDLDHMVGQEKAKKQIRDFVDLARHYNRQGIKLSTRMSLQWCFTGNSGMGKRAMARIIARLYKAMGIIDKATVSDFKADKLIGLTEEEAQRVLEATLMKADGGILLFDEDSRKLPDAAIFRERVRALLANQLAERPGACMVIYAGQQPTLQSFGREVEKMADLINVLVFENYSNEELMQILKRKLSDENMKLTFSARQHMSVFIGRLTATEDRNRASARLMRIVAELMIRNCVQRMAKSGISPVKQQQPVSVIKADVAAFTEDFIAALVNERKKIGFTS